MIMHVCGYIEALENESGVYELPSAFHSTWERTPLFCNVCHIQRTYTYCVHILQVISSMLHLLLTLSAHAHEGYGSHFVCVCSCVKSFLTSVQVYTKMNLLSTFLSVYFCFQVSIDID